MLQCQKTLLKIALCTNNNNNNNNNNRNDKCHRPGYKSWLTFSIQPDFLERAKLVALAAPITDVPTPAPFPISSFDSVPPTTAVDTPEDLVESRARKTPPYLDQSGDNEHDSVTVFHNTLPVSTSLSSSSLSEHSHEPTSGVAIELSASESVALVPFPLVEETLHNATITPSADHSLDSVSHTLTVVGNTQPSASASDRCDAASFSFTWTSHTPAGDSSQTSPSQTLLDKADSSPSPLLSSKSDLPSKLKLNKMSSSLRGAPRVSPRAVASANQNALADAAPDPLSNKRPILRISKRANSTKGILLLSRFCFFF